MSPEQAWELLRKVLLQFRATPEEHQILQQALLTLKPQVPKPQTPGDKLFNKKIEKEETKKS